MFLKTTNLNLFFAFVENINNIFFFSSDGWDRTSQLTSLTMLLLDPSYRTLQVFFFREILIFFLKF